MFDHDDIRSECIVSELSMYEYVSMCSVNMCEHLLLCGSSVSVCSLSAQLHMLFPPGWRLGLSVKGGGGGGMEGKGRKGAREGEGRRAERATYPRSKEMGGRGSTRK